MWRNRVRAKWTGRHLEVQYTPPCILIMKWENNGLSTLQMCNTVSLHKSVKPGFVVSRSQERASAADVTGT
jgi:hypothetical protein